MSGASAFSLKSVWWWLWGTCYFKKKLQQVFVNLSLIISTEVENKLPANDAEREIMPGFLKASYGSHVSPQCQRVSHVNLWGNCHFSWGIEEVCQWEHVIVWLAVNVIQLHLFSCPKRQITHCGFFYNERRKKWVLCSTSSSSLSSVLHLFRWEWPRVQGNEVQHFVGLPNWIYVLMLISVPLSTKINEIHHHKRLTGTSKVFFFYTDFYLFVLCKSSCWNSLELKCLLKCVWRSVSHQGCSCTFIGSRSLEWYIWL